MSSVMTMTIPSSISATTIVPPVVDDNNMAKFNGTLVKRSYKKGESYFNDLSEIEIFFFLYRNYYWNYCWCSCTYSRNTHRRRHISLYKTVRSFHSL